MRSKVAPEPEPVVEPCENGEYGYAVYAPADCRWQVRILPEPPTLSTWMTAGGDPVPPDKVTVSLAAYPEPWVTTAITPEAGVATAGAEADHHT